MPDGFRDSELSREVERLHDSAKNAQELNGDCRVTLDRKLREGTE